MDYHIQNLHKKIRLFFFAFTAILMFSCSQNPIDISQSEMCVVFEYSDQENLPSARLCAFVESESDSRRREELEVTSNDYGYIWTSDDLVCLKKGERNWVGYTNFVMQNNEPFPDGDYRVLIRNSDQKEIDEIIDFKYNSAFYSLKADEASEKMSEDGAVKKVAVYDENSLLLYFDEMGEKFDSARKIWNVYSNAAYFNVVWQSNDGFVICILPKQLVKPESDKNLELD